MFPERFASVGDARAFMATFVEDYNHTHRHTGIGLNTPADVHYGLAAAKALQRLATLAAARAQNPERFATTADTRILALPDTTRINKPAEKADEPTRNKPPKLSLASFAFTNAARLRR